MLSYIIHFCCTELYSNKESKELFENYRSNDIFTVNEEIMLQSLQVFSKIINF